MLGISRLYYSGEGKSRNNNKPPYLNFAFAKKDMEAYWFYLRTVMKPIDLLLIDYGMLSNLDILLLLYRQKVSC